MSTTLSDAYVTAKIDYKTTTPNPGFSPIVYPVSIEAALKLNLANITKAYGAQVNLAASASITLDLTALTDPEGNAVSFAHIVYLMIQSADGQPFSIGPGASNGLQWFFDDTTAKLSLRLNGFALLGDGDGSTSPQVVDSTHKTLTITNTGGSTGNFNIVLMGN